MEVTLNRLICKIITHYAFYIVEILSNFIHSNYFFKTLIQSFYKALSHISIRARNKSSAGLINRPHA